MSSQDPNHRRRRDGEKGSGKGRKAARKQSGRRMERELDERALNKNLSGYSEMFFAAQESPLDRPVLFHHIQKTAGTALRKFIRSALPPHERVVRSVEGLSRQPREALLEWYRGWYAGLSEDERDRMCCLMAHSANYLLPSLDRPVNAMSLVREPVDRTVSQYYGTKARRGNPLEASRAASEVKNRSVDWTLVDIYAQLGGTSPRELDSTFGLIRFFNGQSRSLLASHYDTRDLGFSKGPPSDADLWRERLFTLVDDHYTLGVQERFDEFVAQLAPMFGQEPWIPHAKVNSHRPPLSDVSEQMQETIRAYNWLDVELHSRASEQMAARAVGTPAGA